MQLFTSSMLIFDGGVYFIVITVSISVHLPRFDPFTQICYRHDQVLNNEITQYILQNMIMLLTNDGEMEDFVCQGFIRNIN
jgi:hypothetical protein